MTILLALTDGCDQDLASVGRQELKMSSTCSLLYDRHGEESTRWYMARQGSLRLAKRVSVGQQLEQT